MLSHVVLHDLGADDLVGLLEHDTVRGIVFLLKRDTVNLESPFISEPVGSIEHVGELLDSDGVLL